MEATAKAKANMNCTDCDIRCASFGKHCNGLRRFRCGQCGKTYTEAHAKPLGEMTVPMEKAILALRMLLEGSSVRSVERITELHRDTILKLLVVAGTKCEKVMGRCVRNIAVEDVERDEIWSFLGKKEKRVGPEDDQNMGDCYTFVAIERNTKLVLNIAMGKRDQLTTNSFIEGLRDSIKPGTSFQITTDDFQMMLFRHHYFPEGQMLLACICRPRGPDLRNGLRRTGWHDKTAARGPHGWK